MEYSAGKKSFLTSNNISHYFLDITWTKRKENLQKIPKQVSSSITIAARLDVGKNIFFSSITHLNAKQVCIYTVSVVI